MPIFEYRCKDCGKRFESLVLARSAKPAECPACRSRKVEQQLSVFAVAGASAKSGGSFSAGDSAGNSDDAGGACGSCGDPRGPGACAMDDLD
jgi:putative FmdB family regulatory protein